MLLEFCFKLCLNYEQLNTFAHTQSAPGTPRRKHRVNFTQGRKLQKYSFQKSLINPEDHRKFITSDVSGETEPKFSVHNSMSENFRS